MSGDSYELRFAELLQNRAVEPGENECAAKSQTAAAFASSCLTNEGKGLSAGFTTCMNICGNKIKVAAYQQRKRAARKEDALKKIQRK
jgi:hypothetical protein